LELTYRETELLKLVAAGYTLPEQADRMYLGYNTVCGYRQKLNVKLRVRNTVQLLKKAKALSLI
jgi:DNA-binding CsgD family transcriptional regulator